MGAEKDYCLQLCMQNSDFVFNDITTITVSDSMTRAIFGRTPKFPPKETYAIRRSLNNWYKLFLDISSHAHFHAVRVGCYIDWIPSTRD